MMVRSKNVVDNLLNSSRHNYIGNMILDIPRKDLECRT